MALVAGQPQTGPRRQILQVWSVRTADPRTQQLQRTREGRIEDELWSDSKLSLRRRLRAAIRQLKPEVPGTLAIKEPVRPLETKEWRRRIGEDWYQLLTDPNAAYRSRTPLSSHRFLMEA